jgi:hypothetical protein
VVIGKKTDSLRKKLAKLPEVWVVAPPLASPEPPGQ